MAPAHLQHDEIERPEPLADCLIFRGEARIAAEEDGVPLRTDDERRPQSRVAIAQAAAGKVLRGRGGHGQPGVRQLVRFPPVELDDALWPDALVLKVRAAAERGHERHDTLGDLVDRRIVEVGVVVVRYDHEVHRRHRAKGYGHRLEALGAGERRWRRAPSPDRIGEHAKAVDLDQHRGMTEPGGSKAAGGPPGPRFERAHRWQRPPRRSALAVAEKFSKRRHRRARVAQARDDRVHVAEALARPAWRSLDALEPLTSWRSAERLHQRVSPVCGAMLYTTPCSVS